VSQVKAKVLDAVYRNTPFSLRPNAADVDLEWHCGQGAYVVLQDVDLTSRDAPGHAHGIKQVIDSIYPYQPNIEMSTTLQNPTR
jgi:hypothetical protein